MAPKSLPRALGTEAVATFPLNLLFRLKTKPKNPVCFKMAGHKYSLLFTPHFHTGTNTPQREPSLPTLTCSNPGQDGAVGKSVGPEGARLVSERS